MWFIIARVAAAIVLAIGGGTFAFNEIVYKWKGKTLAILGERRVGKTVLKQFMTGGTIPADYKQTVQPKATDRNRLKLGDLELVIHRSFDVGGGKANYGEWRKEHDGSDLVFYLLRADRLMAGQADTLGRVDSHRSEMSVEARNTTLR